MIYNYEIKKKNNENILYLYISMNYEFANEINFNDTNELNRRTKNYIKSNNINFDGDKVFLIVDNIIVKTFNLNKEKEIELLSDNLYYSNKLYYVNIRYNNDKYIEISLNDFLISSLFFIYRNDFTIETLKAMSILFRTYAFKMMKDNNYIQSENYFLTYHHITDYKNKWSNNYDEILKKINKAIIDTDCLFITYNSNYILPFYHYCNDGKTLESLDFKYLKSVTSFFDLTSNDFINIKKYTYDELSYLLSNTINKNSSFLIQTNEHEIVNKITIDNIEYDVYKFINSLKLKSNLFKVIINKNDIIFITKGCGIFYGISLFGANHLSKLDLNYQQILYYYFPNTKIYKYLYETKKIS